MCIYWYQTTCISQYVDEPTYRASGVQGPGALTLLRSKGSTAEACSFFPSALFFTNSWGVLCLLLLVKSQRTSAPDCLAHLAWVSPAEHELPSQFLWHGEVGWLWGPGSKGGKGQGLSPPAPCLSDSVPWANVPSKGTQFLQLPLVILSVKDVFPNNNPNFFFSSSAQYSVQSYPFHNSPTSAVFIFHTFFCI